MSGPAKRALKWVGALLALAGFSWLSVRWLEVVPLTPSAQGQPDFALQGSVLTHYDGEGKRLWTFSARTIVVDEKAHTTQAEGVEVQFWGAQGEAGPASEKAQLRVTAERMILDNVRQDMTFPGALEAGDDQGLKFRTSNAQWLDKDQVLEGEEQVVVERQDLRLEGRGFRYDLSTGKFLLKTGAHLRWIPAGEGS